MQCHPPGVIYCLSIYSSTWCVTVRNNDYVRDLSRICLGVLQIVSPIPLITTLSLCQSIFITIMRPLLLWSAPRMRTQASSKPGTPSITDFRLVYANSQIGSNSGCYRYKNGLSLRLCRNWPWHDSVFLALTQRKVSSGDKIADSARFRKPVSNFTIADFRW